MIALLAPAPPPGLRDYRWLADRLGISLANARALVARGVIPTVRIGPRSPRFDEKQIEAWIVARSTGGRP